MYIEITCGFGKDQITEVLENFSGNIKFKKVKDLGLRIIFSVDPADFPDPAAEAKKIIRSTPMGNNLIFQISNCQDL